MDTEITRDISDFLVIKAHAATLAQSTTAYTYDPHWFFDEFTLFAEAHKPTIPLFNVERQVFTKIGDVVDWQVTLLERTITTPSSTKVDTPDVSVTLKCVVHADALSRTLVATSKYDANVLSVPVYVCALIQDMAIQKHHANDKESNVVTAGSIDRLILVPAPDFVDDSSGSHASIVSVPARYFSYLPPVNNK